MRSRNGQVFNLRSEVASVENVTRRLRERRAQGIATPVSKEVLDATLEVRTPLLYTTLILFLSVAPILFVRGVAGAFFHPLVLSYGLAVVASMIVALTVTPALCLILLRRAPRRESPLVAWLERLHESALAPIIRRGGLAFGAIVVLAMAGLAVVPFLNPSLVPSFKERSLLIHLTCVPGTSQPEMSRVAGLVCRDLRSIPGVRDVGAHIGRALQGDQVVNVNASQVWVTIDPRANYGKTTAAIQRVVDAYPGVRHKVQTYLKAASEDVVPRSEDDVIVRVYGDVEGSLRSQAENVRKTVAGVRGVEKTYLRLPMQQVTLETEVDLAAARRHGLKPGDVRRGAATLLSGIQVGSLFEAQKVFDVVVWSTPATRHSLHDIGDLLIDTPSGGHVRLGDVATVRMVSAPSVIRHDAVKRYLDVVAEVKGRGLKSVATDITNRVRQVQFPLEYHARVLGESAEAHATRRRLLVSALLAMIGVLLLLHEGFENWRLAALSFLTLPAAITGGLLAVVVTGGVLSSGAIAGLLAVSQIAVSSIMSLITRYQSLERNEGEILGIGLALRGARERVAPMVMTMLATGMALLPAVMLGDVPGLEVVRPMAIVVLGGLLTTALVGMVLVPMLFLSLGVSSVREPERIAFQNSSFGAAPQPRGAAGD